MSNPTHPPAETRGMTLDEKARKALDDLTGALQLGSLDGSTQYGRDYIASREAAILAALVPAPSTPAPTLDVVEKAIRRYTVAVEVQAKMGYWMQEVDDLRAALLALYVPSPDASEAVAEAELGEWMRVAREAIWYARVSAHSHGYALAVHGSLRRDIDVVAVPWTDAAISPDELAEKIVAWLAQVEVCYDSAWAAASKTREEKPHGRIAWSIPLNGLPSLTSRGQCAPYLDLSIIGPVTATPVPSATKGGEG